MLFDCSVYMDLYIYTGDSKKKLFKNRMCTIKKFSGNARLQVLVPVKPVTTNVKSMN